MKSKAMSLISLAVVGLALRAAQPAIAQAPQTQETPMPHNCSITPAELQAEKKVVLDFLRPNVTLRELIALIDPSYIQHNPAVLKAAKEKHISDYEEFKHLFTRIATLSNQGSANVLDGPARQGGRAPQAVIVVAECDLVTAIVRNTPPDPTSPGTSYERFSFDTFRVRGGKLVEHWDDEEISEQSMRMLQKLE
jgi:predicted SnoaL-like aldol condensation-catalyzing enzyme